MAQHIYQLPVPVTTAADTVHTQIKWVLILFLQFHLLFACSENTTAFQHTLALRADAHKYNLTSCVQKSVCDLIAQN